MVAPWPPYGGAFTPDTLENPMFNIDHLMRSQATREANRARPNPQQFDLCACCQRPVHPETAVQVEAAGGGWDLVDQTPEAAQQAEAMRTDGGHMGFWVVGPICAKRIPARFHVSQ